MAGVDQKYVVDVEVIEPLVLTLLRDKCIRVQGTSYWIKACRYVSKDRSPLEAGLEAASIPTWSDIANVSSFVPSIILFRGLSKSFSLSYLSPGVLNPWTSAETGLLQKSAELLGMTSIYDNLWWTLINSVRDAHLCQADVTTLYVVFISTILSFQNKRCLVTTTVFSCLFSFVAQNYICLFLTIFGWHLEINYLLVQSSQYSIRILTEH